MSKQFFLVAGEASGDILGARLITSIKKMYPDANFSGIGGPLMQTEGFTSLFDMERLSVMGIVPILKRLPELLKMRSELAKIIIKAKPDCFIGIDAPEFNLALEGNLKKQGIKTVHYVSPSVWAWREKRIFKIAKSVSLMLCLFPFELAIYKRHQIPAICIGHPLANEIPMKPDIAAARKALGLAAEGLVIAILPGSRGSEVKHLIQPFMETAKKLYQDYPQIRFIIPCANLKRRQQIEDYLAQTQSSVPIELIDGQSRVVMQAADVVLLASGTATLEALLLKKPMLVAYKMAKFSYWIFKRLLKINQFSLPNLVAGETVVKEMIQDDCQPNLLYQEMIKLLETSKNSPQVPVFERLHNELKMGGSEKAAKAIVKLLENSQFEEITDEK